MKVDPDARGVFNPETPMIIDDRPIITNAVFRGHDGITGNIGEIHQTLQACLEVGRLERAATLVQRLNTLYKPDAPGLIAAHNEYLCALNDGASGTHDRELIARTQKWFEFDLLGTGVPPNALTYALMIQTILQESDIDEVKKWTGRYLELAEQHGLRKETMDKMARLLHEEELKRLEEVAISFPLDNVNPEAQAGTPSNVVVDHPPQESSALPKVKSMQVKGLGLQALRQSLSIFAGTGSVPKETSEELVGVGGTQNAMERQRALERQCTLEKNTFTSALERWRQESLQQKKMGINASLANSSIGTLMWDWHTKLVPRIREEIKKANEAEAKKPKSAADKELCQIGPLLQYLPPERLSAVAILTTVSKLSTEGRIDEGVKLSYVVAQIGESVQDESIAETVSLNSVPFKKGEKGSDRLAKVKALFKRRNPRSSFAKLLRTGESVTETTENLQWSQALKVRAGTLLLWHLINVANLDVNSVHPETGQKVAERQPVFFHTFQYREGKRVGILRLHKAVASKIAKEPVRSVISKNLPMIIEPKPWSGFREGGFLEHPIPMVRIKNNYLGKRYAITACSSGDMALTFAGLDVLGKTPWRINRPVLEAMIEAWNTGEKFAEIPPEEPVVDMPPEPSASEAPQKRIEWIKQVKAIENFKSGQRSNRCFQNFQLEVARAYVNETFYFPHNVDFRGRAYPMCPFFNHIGADNCRGLLLFARGKELGSAGLIWLKIHLANLYGYDKASFKEREEFTMEHLRDIYDSAVNPMHGNRWWLKAEDPWQCLGACIELKNALDSPDPERFVSHLAIHQDGTCNGLQHYAALGGDAIGARQVNLEPADRPSDIYTAVAEIVKAEVIKDAAHGNLMARRLEGRVTRKVVKQTVMTNVYGVTFSGAKLQVLRQLEDIFDDTPGLRDVSLDSMAQYIARKIFEALSHMFNGAHDIQYWLGDCAGRIARSLSPEQVDSAAGSAQSKTESPFTRAPTVGRASSGPMTFKTPVIWTNPVRMPVVQPYREASAKYVATNLQAISIRVPSSSDPVSRRKQSSAFPPNFIHSLDASHMILTALKCSEMGLTFASVHDSFWTHAADVDAMNGIIRNEFIRMHSEDVIGRLAAEFTTRYKGYLYLASVKESSAIGKKIMAWRRLTPLNERLLRDRARFQELKLEKQRLDLLASQDANEREKGLAMVTPAQIFETTAHETELLREEDLEGSGIGEIPTSKTAKLQVKEQLEVDDHENAQLLHPNTEVHDTDAIGEAMLDGSRGRFEEKDRIQPEALKVATFKKPSRCKARTTWLWLPLTFPPVPKKVCVISCCAPVPIVNFQVGRLQCLQAQTEPVFLLLACSSLSES